MCLDLNLEERDDVLVILSPINQFGEHQVSGKCQRFKIFTCKRQALATKTAVGIA